MVWIQEAFHASTDQFLFSFYELLLSFLGFSLFSRCASWPQNCPHVSSWATEPKTCGRSARRKQPPVTWTSWGAEIFPSELLCWFRATSVSWCHVCSPLSAGRPTFWCRSWWTWRWASRSCGGSTGTTTSPCWPKLWYLQLMWVILGNLDGRVLLTRKL